MKSLAFLVIAFGLFPLASFAGDTWQCDGDNIESMGITSAHGKLVGDVSWDCWGGGGICDQHATVKLGEDSKGNAVYQGPSFKLVIRTSESPNRNGEYRAYISAIDKCDAADEGRGLDVNAEATCKKDHAKSE